MRTVRLSRLCALASLALWIPLSLPQALAVTPEAAQPPLLDPSGQPTPSVLSRGMDGTPRLLLGQLSAPSPGSNPLTVAERFLIAQRQNGTGLVPSELSQAEVISVGTGHVVRYRQLHLGIPVWASDLVLRISTEGQVVRLARDVVPAQILARVNPVPTLTAEDAQRVVRALGDGSVGGADLVIDNLSGRLAYVVGRINLAALEQAQYLIDAHTGELIRRIERLKFLNQFGVYRYNPATTANIDPLGIPSGDTGPFAPAGSGSRPMTSTLLRGLNCIDNFTLRVPGTGGTAIHLCEPMQSLATAAGDFNQFQPLIGASDGHCPTKNDANKNSFGEAHMYWHAANVYSRFRALFAGMGTSDFRLRISVGGAARPFPLLTNLCMPDLTNMAKATNPAIALNPFENAFYSPGDVNGGYSNLILGTPGDMIAFGMGAKANYSMDGDVIYHEFTHAVISTMKRLTLSVGLDQYGINDDPGAMNEGLADYFSSALTGNSPVGEYAKVNFGVSGAGLRDLDNTLHCSNDRVGEVHEDANAFSGGLWRARKAVTGDPLDSSAAAVQKRQAFDQAVLTALQGSSAGPSMTEMGQLVRDEVNRQAATLGADAGQKTIDALTLHGVLSDCNRVITVQTPHRMLCLDSDAKKLWPSHAQWRLDMPATADTVTFNFTTLGAGAVCNSIDPSATSLPPKLQFAVRSSGTPITWDQSGAGTYDKLVDIQQGGTNNSWTATLSLDRSKSHHVMLVNSGGPRIAQNITMVLSCAAADGCPAPVDPNANGDGGTGSGSFTPTGCSCEIGAAQGSTTLLGLGTLGGLLAMLLRRRRREVRGA